MKRITYPLLLVLLVALVAALSACVRPVPGAQDQPTATPTPLGAIINPTVAILPTVGASATPLPVAPVEPSATPLPVAPVDPTPLPAIDPTVAPGGETIHVVQAGENLFRIGLRYGCTAQQLATHNNIPNVDVISVGQQIRIPACQ